MTIGGFARAQLLSRLGQRDFKKYIQKLRDTELLCLFSLRNCDSEICIQGHMETLWWNQTFHFLESTVFELSKKQECWVFYQNGELLQKIYIWRHFEKLVAKVFSFILFRNGCNEEDLHWFCAIVLLQTFQVLTAFLFPSVQSNRAWSSRLDWS